jgi:uncharacterized protein (UPF0548 family)
VKRLGAASEHDLERLRRADVTYDHVGSTLTASEPAGAHRVGSSISVGSGSEALDAGRRALRSWCPQRALGMTVAPASVAPDLGETVVLGLGLGPVRVVVPTRVVAVVDEPHRYGYAYGTLPGHPERGEELFLLERSVDGDVVLTIRADSVPAGALRAVRPVVDALQRAALGRYLEAVRETVQISAL